jgi:5-carboxymethyl-2-hydroxymuconate isomerase
MPHITMEYSANLEPELDIRRLVDAVHDTVARSGIFELGGIRTRAEKRDAYRVADGDPANGFVHVVIRIAPGRPLEKRKALGEAVLATVSKELDPIYAKRGLAISVEMQELDAALNFRRNNLHERLAAKIQRNSAA